MDKTQVAGEAPIGVFDSGVGGISVLREAVRILPREHFIYFGDNENAPYGVRPPEEILRLTLKVVDILLEKGVKALLIACNTATSAAAEHIRQRLSIPVVGMEPALKPASFLREKGRILVLATPATLSLPKFHLLMQRYGEGAVPVPCPGLMEFAERFELSGEALSAYLHHLFLPYQDAPIDAVVLGCTHYVFLQQAIARALPGVQIVDGNLGTVRHLKELLAQNHMLRAGGEGSVTLLTSSKNPETVELMRKLFFLP